MAGLETLALTPLHKHKISFLKCNEEKDAFWAGNITMHDLWYTVPTCSKRELTHLETMERRVSVVLCEAILLIWSKDEMGVTKEQKFPAKRAIREFKIAV